MGELQAFFASGHAIDVIIVLMLVEAGALIAYRRTSGAGLSVQDVLPNLASGFFLMLGIRFALVQASWMYIGTCLVGSLITHGVDMFRRWPR